MTDLFKQICDITRLQAIGYHTHRLQELKGMPRECTTPWLWNGGGCDDCKTKCKVQKEIEELEDLIEKTKEKINE